MGPRLYTVRDGMSTKNIRGNKFTRSCQQNYEGMFSTLCNDCSVKLCMLVSSKILSFARGILFLMPPFEEEGVYCFANVGWLVGRPNGFR